MAILLELQGMQYGSQGSPPLQRTVTAARRLSTRERDNRCPARPPTPGPGIERQHNGHFGRFGPALARQRTDRLARQRIVHVDVRRRVA
jgi:hypothetical protein